MKRVFLAALVMCFAWTTTADDEVADYRQKVMGAVGDTMGAIGKILKQEVNRPDDIANFAVVLDELAQTVDGLFTEGSEGGDALPAIWENPEDFAEKIDAFKKATAAFREAAASGDMAQTMPAVGGVGRSCKGCHDDYRQ